MPRLHTDEIDVLRAISELIYRRESATVNRIARETRLDTRTVEDALVVLGEEGYFDERDAIFERGSRYPSEVLELSPKARTAL